MEQRTNPPARFLRLPEVQARTGLSRSTIYVRLDQGLFPRPVALDADRAVFVYADPGHETSTALRSWRDAHRGLWEALREQARSVQVIAVVHTTRELRRARTILGNWATAATVPGPSAAPGPGVASARRAIARIEQAIRGMDDAAVEKLGGLQGCLKRILELKDLVRSARPAATIDGFAVWRSSWLSGGGF